MKDRKEIMEKLAEAVNLAFNKECPDKPRFGFCLFLFEFDGDQEYDYISNVKEEDMFNLLMEIALSRKIDVSGGEEDD